MQDRVKAAQELIAYLGERGVTAVICGGYARDTICDKPIRDVDLYVSEEDFVTVHLALFAEYPEGGQKDQGSPEYLHQHITRQLERSLSDGLDFGLPTRIINLIGVHDAEKITVANITQRFNLGICMAGIDSSGLRRDNEFDKDVHDKQITLLRTDWGHEATMKQFLKLQSKYPWPLRVPKEQEWELDV